MAKSLSINLRERLVSAVEGGMTRRSAAKRFGVAASTAIKWADQWRRTGELHYRGMPKGWLMEELLPLGERSLEFGITCFNGVPQWSSKSSL